MVLDTRKSNFVNQQWLQFHIWFIMTLYYKMRQILLQNETIILLQFQIVFHKMQQFYYKLRQLLQNASNLLQNTTAIAKCVVHYKMHR